MAVTAAPTGKVYPVAWMSCRKKLQAGFGRYRNRLLISVISIIQLERHIHYCEPCSAGHAPRAR